MVDDCIDDSISDSLGYDLLSLFDGLERKLGHDVLHGDLGVTDVQLLQTELEDSVPKSEDKRVVLVMSEDSFVLHEDLLEGIHISRLDAVHDLEVRR